MEVFRARCFTKIGALPRVGLGIAVKAEDGAGRAAEVMMIATLMARFAGFDEGVWRRRGRF